MTKQFYRGKILRGRKEIGVALIEFDMEAVPGEAQFISHRLDEIAFDIERAINSSTTIRMHIEAQQACAPPITPPEPAPDKHGHPPLTIDGIPVFLVWVPGPPPIAQKQFYIVGLDDKMKFNKLLTKAGKWSDSDVEGYFTGTAEACSKFARDLWCTGRA